MGLGGAVRRWAMPVAIGVVVGVAATTVAWAPWDDAADEPAPATSQATHPGDKLGHHLTSPTEEVPGTDRRAVVRTTVSLPATWGQVSGQQAQVLGFREGSRGCTYRVLIISRIRLGDQADAASHAASVVPGEGRYVLDSGQRRSVAWRVVRIPTQLPQVKVRAVRVAPLGAISEQLGSTAWLETIATATSDLGDECHSGTYRETLARGLGDAMATATVSAYLRP